MSFFRYSKQEAEKDFNHVFACVLRDGSFDLDGNKYIIPTKKIFEESFKFSKFVWQTELSGDLLIVLLMACTSYGFSLLLENYIAMIIPVVISFNFLSTLRYKQKGFFAHKIFREIQKMYPDQSIPKYIIFELRVRAIVFVEEFSHLDTSLYLKDLPIHKNDVLSKCSSKNWEYGKKMVAEWEKNRIKRETEHNFNNARQKHDIINL